MTTENVGFVWKKTKEGACIVRVYGQMPIVSLPQMLGGLPVYTIGAYCFSGSGLGKERELYFTVNDGWDGAVYTEADCDAFFGKCGLVRICGDFLERTVLPDCVREVEQLAFYNCKNLRELEIGTSLHKIGSDVFMNCRNFRLLRLRGGVQERSGVQKILAQISSEIEVVFGDGEEVEAKVFYPEYFESYDEIAPAHIFGRNIVGEGFRARQCFKDGSADLSSYDIIFKKACAEETEETLSRIAMNRLRYPASLHLEEKQRYESYVREHAAGIGKRLVDQRELAWLEFLLKQKLIGWQEQDLLIRRAAVTKWSEGTAALLRLKQENAKESLARRYSFDD